MISAVILAAGLARRMGKPKLLLKLGDKTVIEHVVDNALAAGIGETIVVLGAHQEEFRQVLTGRNIITVDNARFHEGQGTSVAAAAAAVSPQATGILFLMGDQPFVSVSLINRLIQEFDDSKALIVRQAGSGTPAVFRTELLTELKQLSGDVGGRQLIEKYPATVRTVNLAAPPETIDLDTEQDYENARELWARVFYTT